MILIFFIIDLTWPFVSNCILFVHSNNICLFNKCMLFYTSLWKTLGILYPISCFPVIMYSGKWCPCKRVFFTAWTYIYSWKINLNQNHLINIRKLFSSFLNWPFIKYTISRIVSSKNKLLVWGNMKHFGVMLHNYSSFTTHTTNNNQSM